ncbi:MAG: hypothetical protein ACRC6R_04215 [Bacteroidales bacterium]
MKLIISTSEEYSQLFLSSTIVFNTPSFAQINQSKCQRLHYLLFKDSKLRLGLILGEKQESLYCPFSSPFGCFEQADKGFINLEIVDQALSLLKEYASNQGKRLTITLPPVNYDRDLISKMVSSFSRLGFIQESVDLSYYIPTCDPQSYRERLKRNARKNLSRSESSDLSFIVAQSDSEKVLAYDVIKHNRQSKGYPLRMSYEDIIMTSSVVRINFFLIMRASEAIASAIVFDVTDRISQVVYWGNIESYSDMRPMNFLAIKLVEHYHYRGVDILDIGPSTEDGLPNYGLCEFKSSIGCESDLKFKFTFNPLN